MLRALEVVISFCFSEYPDKEVGLIWSITYIGRKCIYIQHHDFLSNLVLNGTKIHNYKTHSYKQSLPWKLSSIVLWIKSPNKPYLFKDTKFKLLCIPNIKAKIMVFLWFYSNGEINKLVHLAFKLTCSSHWHTILLSDNQTNQQDAIRTPPSR